MSADLFNIDPTRITPLRSIADNLLRLAYIYRSGRCNKFFYTPKKNTETYIISLKHGFYFVNNTISFTFVEEIHMSDGSRHKGYTAYYLIYYEYSNLQQNDFKSLYRKLLSPKRLL